MREAGSSALDRRTTWAAPDPTTMVLDRWGAPASIVAAASSGPWPAPDPSMRVEMAPPTALAFFVEPRHAVQLPDVAAAQRAALAPPTPAVGRPLPPPTLADAAAGPTPMPVVARARDARRRAVGIAAAAGAACAAVAAALTVAVALL